MEKKYKPVFDAFYKLFNNHLKETGKEIPCRSLHKRTQEFIEKISMPLFKNYAESTTKEKRAELMDFRLLSDDRFVNKKGQVVFVKATMVRGQAQTLKNKKTKDEIGRGY